MNKKNLIPVVGIGVVVVLGILGAVKVFKNSKPAETPPQSSQPASSPAKDSNTTACTPDYDQNKFQTAKVNIVDQVVTMDVKNYGSIKIQLDDKDAPKTVENFLKLVNAGFYDCLTFHRVASGFVIQGGDPKGDGTGGPGYTIPAEIKLLHKAGSIAMARQGDEVNPQRKSNGSQFYIALKDLPQLDGAYTVFGQVISGLDIAEKIGMVPTSPPGDGMPTTPVVIEKAIISSK